MSDLRMALARNIRAAREKMGWRQEDLAQVIDAKSSEIVSQIEKGGREVKAWELSRIADALHVEFQDLLSPSGPQFGPAPLWRKEAAVTKRETEARLRQRSQRYRAVMELTDSCPQVELPWHDEFDVLGNDYEEIERQARTVGDQLQLGHRPAHRLFSLLEDDYCVMIFYQNLDQDGSAVSVRGPYGPAMLLNSREPPWRRNFSCAHELFHLLTWKALPTERLGRETDTFAALERHADAFASALLLPTAPLMEVLKDAFKGDKVEIRALISVAREFGVSTQALLWRMSNLRLIPRQKTQELLGDAGFKQADKASMMENWWTPLDLPKRFVELAFVACKQGRLSQAKLAAMLETDLTGLPQVLAEYGLGMEIDLVYAAQVAHP